MCVSAWDATFSSTITGTCEVMVDGRVNHVVWYENQVGRDTSHRGEPVAIQGYGNCLLIPLLGLWESIRLLNPADTPRLLSNIGNALDIPANDFLLPLAAALVRPRRAPEGRVAFLQFDVYDLLLAEYASDIPGLLPQIQERKRPAVNDDVFTVLGDWYRSPIAVCCFNSEDQAKSKPLGFAFEPIDPDNLVVYTLDAHDGGVPKASAQVIVDHIIFVGSYLMADSFGMEVTYQDKIPDHLQPYVPSRVMGMPLRVEKLINGDIVFRTKDVRNGLFEGTRKLPQYAPSREEADHLIMRRAGYRNGNYGHPSRAQT